MKFKMTIVNDVNKSTGRQITVEITGNDAVAKGRVKHLGNPYRITQSFGKNDADRYIMTQLRNAAKTALRNYRNQSKSLVHATEDFDP